MASLTSQVLDEVRQLHASLRLDVLVVQVCVEHDDGKRE